MGRHSVYGCALMLAFAQAAGASPATTPAPATATATATATAPAPAPSCSAQRGFDLGHAGVTDLGDCGGTEAFLQSWQLGLELAGLEKERASQAALAAQAKGDAANQHARRVRHLEVDIEAIHGALLLRGIVTDGPSVEAAGAATQTEAADPSEDAP